MALNKKSHFLSVFYQCVAINTDNGFFWTMMQLIAQEDSSRFVPTSDMEQGLSCVN